MRKKARGLFLIFGSRKENILIVFSESRIFKPQKEIEMVKA
jgi:hypothetical protein